MNIATRRLGLCLVLGIVACADDGKGAVKSDQDLIDAGIDKLKECELYSPPEDPDDYAIHDDYDRCAIRCYEQAKCDDLKQLVCAASPNLDSAFLNCVLRCDTAPDDGFQCSDGWRIAHAALCDGQQDCPNGQDEEDCKGFTCEDGEELELEFLRCDGSEDCGDGSDEADCPDLCA